MGTRHRRLARGHSPESPHSSAQPPSSRRDILKGLGVAIAGGALVFLSIIGWLTLQNTYAVVGEHSGDLNATKHGVQQIVGFGAGLEWQNAQICSAVHIDCTIAPAGPPPGVVSPSSTSSSVPSR
jgi:hypothetical protein